MEQNALFIKEEDLRLPVVSANPYEIRFKADLSY